jgi:hypothetical protein
MAQTRRTDGNRPELIDQLLVNHKKPEDIIDENGLLPSG